MGIRKLRPESVKGRSKSEGVGVGYRVPQPQPPRTHGIKHPSLCTAWPLVGFVSTCMNFQYQ